MREWIQKISFHFLCNQEIETFAPMWPTRSQAQLYATILTRTSSAPWCIMWFQFCQEVMVDVSSGFSNFMQLM